MPDIRVPPQFVDGERAILGGMLLDNECIEKITEMVAPEDFYREANRILFKAIKHLNDKGEPADWVTLAAILEKYGKLDLVGGTGALAELVDAVPSAANAHHYAKIVHEKALLRQLICATGDINQAAYDDPEDVRKFIDEAEAKIFRIAMAENSQGFVRAKDLTKPLFDKLEELYEHKSGTTGVPSGFRDLDLMTAGWQNSDLIIVAGRPSMGKTSLAMNCLDFAATQCDTPVGIFSLEMSKEQLMLRLLCSKAKVNMRSVQTGFLSNEDWGRLILAIGVIDDAPIWIDDTPALSPLQVRARARRLKREHNVGVIAIDYLQLMKSDTAKQSREAEISEISRSMKALAKELNIPVIALSQLNRKCEDRPNKRPQLADLRESGAIEQDADVILFIYRDEVYNKDEDNPKKGEAEIIVGKQRNGPVGLALLNFEKTISTFRPFAAREYEEAM
jgi:replicative DNA helicase